MLIISNTIRFSSQIRSPKGHAPLQKPNLSENLANSHPSFLPTFRRLFPHLHPHSIVCLTNHRHRHPTANTEPHEKLTMVKKGYHRAIGKARAHKV
ncbi:hypothetical protein B9Z19DRAFT_1092965, partial [Tuber borchii]